MDHSEDFDLIFKKEKVEEAKELLESIRRDISEVDEDLYQSVISISQAKGFEEVARDSDFIDMTQPEKLITACREDSEKTNSMLNTFMTVAQDFSSEKISKEDLPTIQKRLMGEEIISGEKEIVTGGQLLYGPPEVMNPPVKGEPISQVLYGPPELVQPPIEEPVSQLLYGPPEVFEPPVDNTISPLLYGPPLPDSPAPTPNPTPIPTPPPTSVDVPTQGESITPTPVPTSSLPEYAAIPDTGVEFTSKPSHVAPAAMAGAIAGIVGSSMGIKSEKKEKYESKRKKDKEKGD